jgi:hypothetical protein
MLRVAAPSGPSTGWSCRCMEPERDPGDLIVQPRRLLAASREAVRPAKSHVETGAQHLDRAPNALQVWLARVAIAAASVAVSLALLELLLRLVPGLTAGIFIKEPRTRPTSFGVAHPYIGHLHTPNSQIVIEGKDFRAVHDTDGHGFRNPWPWPERADVVAVGDSVTFGYGVASREAWPSVLAAALPDVAVVNLGLIGASAPHYLRVYEVFGAPLRPRLLLIGVFAQNDFWDAGLFDHWLRSGTGGNYMEWRETAPRSSPTAKPSGGSLKRTLAAVTQRSSVLQLVHQVWRRHLERPLYYAFPDGSMVRLLPHDFAQKTKGAAAHRPEYGLVLDPLLKLHRLAREQGSLPLVVLLPSKEEVHLDFLGVTPPDPARDLRGALQEHGVDHVDLVPLFRERAAAGSRLFFEEDGHPNAEGYALIAEGVVRHLRTRRSVQELPSGRAN